MMMMMEKEHLDHVLVPLGLLVFVGYHAWLLYSILRNPLRTVIGVNAESRHQWILCMMSDPLKNGVLAIQTHRNNIMASTLLATTAITLSSLVGIFAGTTWSNNDMASIDYSGSSIKSISITVCFLVAFLCNVQSIRYYAHVSFLITAPTLRDKGKYMEYITKTLNRGIHSWSLGLSILLVITSHPMDLWSCTYVCMLLLDIIYFVLFGHNS